jgi:hypothetical protein
MTSCHTRAPIESLLYLVSPAEKRKALEYLLKISSEQFRPIIQRKLDVTITIERNPNEIFHKICSCIRAVTGAGDFEKTASRVRSEAFGRQLASYFMLLEYKEVPGFGLQKIGSFFEPKKHHATVIHSRRQVENSFFTDKKSEADILNIAECLAEFGIKEPLHIVQQLKTVKDAKNKKQKAV